jgi:hypothetical protein
MISGLALRLHRSSRYGSSPACKLARPYSGYARRSHQRHRMERTSTAPSPSLCIMIMVACNDYRRQPYKGAYAACVHAVPAEIQRLLDSVRECSFAQHRQLKRMTEPGRGSPDPPSPTAWPDCHPLPAQTGTALDGILGKGSPGTCPPLATGLSALAQQEGHVVPGRRRRPGRSRAVAVGRPASPRRKITSTAGVLGDGIGAEQRCKLFPKADRCDQIPP